MNSELYNWYSLLLQRTGLLVAILSCLVQLIGTFFLILVSAIAIFGEQIRAMLLPPELEISLNDVTGELNNFPQGPTFYYHLRVENKRQSSPANHVQILCTAVAKPAADGTFVQHPQTAPEQLTWRYSNLRRENPIIAGNDICDLGCITQGQNRFVLALYLYPPNFPGFILAGETMRVSLIARADNFVSSHPTLFDITWDGQWSSDPVVMAQHLTIRRVNH